MNFNSYFPPGKDKLRSRVGIATLVIVIVIVVVVGIAGAGVYVLVVSAPGATGTSTTTVIIGPTTSTATLQSVTTVTQSSGAQGSQNYKGTYTYANPLGPFGINDSSGKPVEWNSTQMASGSFTFSVNPATYLGTGNGQGTMVVTTRGYCTGTVTVPYTFSIQVVHPPGENFVISFNTPTPSSATVALTCQGSTLGFNTANNPVAFLSVYPNGLSIASFPSTSSQPPTAGISYTVTITQTS